MVAMGDLIESGQSGSQVLIEIAGLIVWRQVEVWKDFSALSLSASAAC